MQILKPPQFTDSSKQRQARLNHILIVTMLMGVIFYSIIILFIIPSERIRVVLTGTLLVVSLIANWFNQTGKVDHASWLFVCGLFFILILGAFINGGVWAPGYITSTILVLLAGVMIHLRAAALFASLGMIWGGLMMWGMTQNIIVGLPPALAVFLAVSISYFFVISLIYYATSNINRALRQAEAELAERERAERALQQSELRYKRLLEEVWDVVYTISLDGRILSLNSAFEDLTGYPVEQWIDKPLLPLFAAKDREAVLLRIAEIATGKASFPPTEYEVVKKDGGSIIVEFASSLIDNEAEPILMGIARDVTEKRRIEEALQQTQKLDSLGMMAGGIAHDFNNLLVGMLAQTSLAERLLPDDSPAHKPIQKAVQAAESAADLTRQLLAYSGRGNFEIRPLNVNQLIQQNLHIFEVAIPKHIAIVADFHESLPLIKGDKGQIQQIIMNLILNAAQAMGDQPGKITITTSIRDLGENDTTFTRYTGGSLRTGHYVLFSVADEGKGMDEETLNHIFDPFYSTKADGYGLGLAAVLGIVRGHRGGICVKSKVDEGTIFKLVLPILE